MSGLIRLPGEGLTYVAATIANVLAQQLSLAETDILSNVLNAIGDNLAIIASQREALITLAENAKKAEKTAGGDSKDTGDAGKTAGSQTGAPKTDASNIGKSGQTPP